MHRSKKSSNSQLTLVAVIRACLKCGTDISDKKETARYCSERCSRRAHEKRRRKKSNATLARRMERQRAYVHSLKQAPCVDCGGKFPPICMDFDHRDPTKKKWGVGNMINISMERIKAEAAKCDLVCANCHRIRTAKQQGWRNALWVGESTAASVWTLTSVGVH